MERAIIKLPMKRKITGSEKGARAVLISARPKRTQRITPRRAVMGEVRVRQSTRLRPRELWRPAYGLGEKEKGKGIKEL